MLCSHRWEQPRSAFGTTSNPAAICSLREFDLGPPSLPSFSRGAELNLCTMLPRWPSPALPASSGNLARGVIGLVGEEFKDMTEGGEENDAGARTVKVRSSFVKFEA